MRNAQALLRKEFAHPNISPAVDIGSVSEVQLENPVPGAHKVAEKQRNPLCAADTERRDGYWATPPSSGHGAGIPRKAQLWRVLKREKATVLA